jgi:hypothetical protein
VGATTTLLTRRLSLTEETEPVVANPRAESRTDVALDHFVEHHPGLTHSIDNLLIPGFDQKLDAVLGDLDREAAADQAMLDEFAKRADAEAPGVSVQVLRDADKTFDDHEVVSIARDCCLILLKARFDEQADRGEAELSPNLEDQLRQAIARDVGAHHHHLLPSLEIDDGRIVKAQLVDGKEVVTVRLSLRGEQLVRDDASGEVVEGSTNVITWQEDWSLTRDPRVDTTGEDVELTAAGQWFIAHRGWVVTDIEGVTASVPSPSSLLI